MKLVEIARTTEFFRGFNPAEIEDLLYRLNGVKKTYAKGETVLHAGLPADRLVLVVSGRLHVYEQMSEERQVLVREIVAGEVIGLWILNVPEVTSWPGTVEATEPCTLVTLDLASCRRLFASRDPLVARLAVNASKILSRQLFATWHKLTVMDAPTIETRIQVYLTELDNESGRTGTVIVPFDRERMAEYFGVARPSLSRTLCQMRDRGLLNWRKNVFKIRF